MTKREFHRTVLKEFPQPLTNVKINIESVLFVVYCGVVGVPILEFSLNLNLSILKKKVIQTHENMKDEK